MMRNFILILLSSTHAMAQESLPFFAIPAAPEQVTTATILARMIQGLGFRYHWATEGLRAEDLSYRPSPEAQSALETLQHIYGLALVIHNTTLSQANLRPLPNIPDDIKSLRSSTLELLKKASENFIQASEEDIAKMHVIFDRQGKESRFPIWNLMNGPIEDLAYHTGQIVSFRRTTGNPIPKGVNVFMGTKN